MHWAGITAVSGYATLSEVQVYLNEVEQDRLAEAAMVNALPDQIGHRR
jgi:hypothetical protein